MVVNDSRLIWLAPIKDMLGSKQGHGGVTHGLGEAGYDICISQDITFKPKKWWQFWKNNHIIVRSGYCLEDNKFDLIERREGRFTLASAVEKFDMPDNLVGIVHDKSSWARQGLSVFNTVIEPGWTGFLTLELVFHGDQELHISAGSGIAQVIFHEVSNPRRYEGRYQNQLNRPVPAIKA